MANIRILPQDFELTKGSETIISLGTKDTYVLEDIDVVVKPHTGSFNNAPTTGVTYTENTETKTILPAGGYLYLNKGWFDDTKISLGHLIPDDADYPNAGVAHILSGYEAYDTDGTKLIGTMATVTPKFDGGGLTVTPTVTGLKNPTVTVSSSGSFKSATTFGVTTTKPTTGTDGENYLTIDGSTSKNDGSVTATATYSRDAVLYNGATTGYIDKADNTEALPAIASTSTTSTAQGITPTITDNFAPLYIPIVSLTNTGTGGAVTASATASIDTYEAPKLDYTTSGTIIDNGMTKYGVSNTVPTSGDYFSLIINPDLTETGEVSGTASGTWNRTAVKSNGTYKGAVSLTTDTQFLAEGSGDITSTPFKQFVNINWDATVGKREWYFTKATLGNITGGDLSAETLSITSNTDPYVTPDISFLSRTNSTNGSAITLSTYGITTTAPTTGNWVVFEPTGTPTGAEYTGSVSVTRSEASVNVTKGLTTGDTKSLTSTSKTYTNKVTITAGVKDGTNRYIPVVAPTATVDSHEITIPIVQCSEEAKYYINGTVQTSTPSGILIEQTSNPSDFNTKSYIKITPSTGITKGSSTAYAGANINAGITKGGVVESENSTKEVDVSISSTKSCFIKVYDGTYSVK